MIYSTHLRILRRLVREIRRKIHTDHRNIRNIGILAHIDAGKTTTTERMLFYSGKTRALGEVHHGNTVTDFLVQERERGITICSAAASFDWKDYRINLLDTPGHIDFTMEVEQSLAAVDGTVIILDASAGVEAQTVTVWNQTERHNLPRIVFANKMDRRDADFDGCLEDLRRKLGAIPLPLQMPIHDGQTLQAIVDVIQRKQLRFDAKSQGMDFRVTPVDEKFVEEVEERRRGVIDLLSGVDDALAETIIAQDSLENLDLELILDAVRRACIERRVVPVLLGSAYKNTGVQPLMDAILNFLPAPSERNKIYDCFGSEFAAKVFKVTHDKQRGPLSLIRVYRGSLKRGAKVTTNRGNSEQVQRIYEPLADEYRDIGVVNEGDIGVCAGLKNTMTGDILVSSVSALKNAQKKLETMLTPEGDVLQTAFSLEPHVPDAVYFCSIEPPSATFQTALEAALKQIQREDPSLRIRYDEATAQTVLGGMGELHLDIIRSRLLTEYKIEADLGPLQIAYKETIIGSVRDTWSTDKVIAGEKQNVQVELSLHNKADCKHSDDFRLDTTKGAAEALASVYPKYIQLVKRGALLALERGPRVGGPVVDVQIKLHALQVLRSTADSFVSAAAAQAVHRLLAQAESRLLEPIMSIHLTVPTERAAGLIADLSRRRATIQDVHQRGANKLISALAPLAELAGYSNVVRTVSSGTATLAMTPHEYALMRVQDEEIAVQRAQGLL